jgi:hypothetical protein
MYIFRGQSDLTYIILPEEIVLSFYYFSGSRSGLANLLRARAQMVYKFREILSRAHGNYEEHWSLPLLLLLITEFLLLMHISL